MQAAGIKGIKRKDYTESNAGAIASTGWDEYSKSILAAESGHELLRNLLFLETVDPTRAADAFDRAKDVFRGQGRLMDVALGTGFRYWTQSQKRLLHAEFFHQDVVLSKILFIKLRAALLASPSVGIGEPDADSSSKRFRPVHDVIKNVKEVGDDATSSTDAMDDRYNKADKKWFVRVLGQPIGAVATPAMTAAFEANRRSRVLAESVSADTYKSLSSKEKRILRIMWYDSLFQ